MGLNKTQNIGLNNWLGNEFPKRQSFADDNVIIDTEIQALKDTVGSGLVATNITIADTTNVFTAVNVEGALLENKTSICALGEQLGVNVQELIQTNNNIVNLLV